MTIHLDSLARVSVVLGMALVAMPLLRGRSAAVRRLVLAVTFASVLVIPLLPVWHVNAPVYQALAGRVLAEPSAAAAGVEAASGPSPAIARSVDVLALVWALGALVVAARFGIGLFLARRVARRAEPPVGWESAIARVERETGLRAVVGRSVEVDAPALTGIVSPVIVVPAASARWSEDRKVSVLHHELAHVTAHDLAVQLLAAVVCSLHWYSPLAWLAARRLRLERELAADEAVLRSGARASAYAADLLAIAGAAPAGMVAMGAPPLTCRVTAILAERRPVRLGPKGALAIAAGTTAITVAVGCVAAPRPGSAPAVVAASAPLDRELQKVAESELDRALAEWKAPGGTILVLSPKGDVLADAGGRADRPYVAGSTMKPFLLAAAMDEDVVKESDVFDCRHGERGGKVLRDASPLGEVPLSELVVTSSNVGFAQIFDRLGGARADHALRRFHFATPPELAHAPSGDWAGALAAIGITMTATPRQVAQAYAALADGGDGIVKPSTAARVTGLLEGVVASEHGTGTKARVPGVRVAGKTGTSEWSGPGGTTATYASFVGYVPAERPRFVIFVGVESPTVGRAWGGEVAAPVFSRIAARALGGR